jgi:hypothetical protein
LQKCSCPRLASWLPGRTPSGGSEDTSKLTWAFAATGFVWLTFIIGLTMSDIVSRNWIPANPF